MKNNLEARTRLISEEKLQRELALQRFENAESKNAESKNVSRYWGALIIVLSAVAVLYFTDIRAEAHNNSQVSVHNYCMVHDCLVTPEAAKYMETDGHGTVLSEDEIE